MKLKVNVVLGARMYLPLRIEAIFAFCTNSTIGRRVIVCLHVLFLRVISLFMLTDELYQNVAVSF